MTACNEWAQGSLAKSFTSTFHDGAFKVVRESCNPGKYLAAFCASSASDPSCL